MSFTVFSYNATVLLIQPNPTHQMCWKMRPNPTHGWTRPMSISGTGLPRLSWKRPLNGSSSSSSYSQGEVWRHMSWKQTSYNQLCELCECVISSGTGDVFVFVRADCDGRRPLPGHLSSSASVRLVPAAPRADAHRRRVGRRRPPLHATARHLGLPRGNPPHRVDSRQQCCFYLQGTCQCSFILPLCPADMFAVLLFVFHSAYLSQINLIRFNLIRSFKHTANYSRPQT